MIRTIIRPIVILWERFFAWSQNITLVENSPYGLLKICSHPYKGTPITLSDGTTIVPGDYILELHISNLTIDQGEVAGIKVASNIQLLSLFREEIYNLSRLVRDKRFDDRVKAIWGVTTMGPALRRLGFELKPMKEGFQSRALGIWMNFLKWFFNPTNNKDISKRKPKRKVYNYWMSIDQLMEKYEDQSTNIATSKKIL